ncbi:MAG: TRAP transporter permease [Armatimonadota bacterium]|nr:TRAP transporter permease [Armatimonadota bacterium]MDR7518034.1 TRAP transporter permease [Armatimonadota bacterium]MDR7550497.1 TRAP transporter permease [Armatimonadota bacterium]
MNVEGEARLRLLVGTLGWLVAGVGLAMSSFQIWAIYLYVLDPWLLRATHLFFAMALAFLILPARRRSPVDRLSWPDALLAIAGLVPVVYVALWFDGLILRAGSIPEPADVLMGGLVVLLLLEATRRATGPALPIISLLFIGYALAGQHLPQPLGHRGYPLARLVSHLFSPDGIYGIPLGASAYYVFTFVLFGAFLKTAQIDRFFVDLALALAGRRRGGPAKMSIISSSLFGTVSGSAVANVMVDGVINIPMMKSSGFPPHVAGAIEAVTSTGGQIVPPVMGAAAFLMADILGVPYAKIALAAIIPALLYYIATYWMIDFEAAKRGIAGLPKERLPALAPLLRSRGYLLLPMAVVLVTLMAFQYSPTRAALLGILTALGIRMLQVLSSAGPAGSDEARRPADRLRRLLTDVTGALATAPQGVIEIATTCATAGIVVGVLSLTGLGLKFAGIVVAYSGQQLGLALVLTMIVTLILGMGMPTVAAYAMAATVAVPALVQLGADRLAAHMFVFYFACISSYTPPVALAAYAAATLSGANVWSVGVYAVRLGIAGFVVPFMFVYGPPLLGNAPTSQIMIALVTASVGALLLSASVQGWLVTRALLWERGLLLVASLLLIDPGLVTDLVGAASLGLVLVSQRLRQRALRLTGPAGISGQH